MRRPLSRALSEDERIARYAHILGELPSSIADRAYAEAFAGLPVAARRELAKELRAQLPSEVQSADPRDPDEFALLMRNLHARVALVTCRDAGALAVGFVTSRATAAYYRSGAGSLSIDRQPPWVHALAEHETAPIDAGGAHHSRGAISGERRR